MFDNSTTLLQPLCQCDTNMKQGILKKPICDFYYHEKFKKSVSHCKVSTIMKYILRNNKHNFIGYC